MRKFQLAGVLAIVLLAGCGGFGGGPNVVEDECRNENTGITRAIVCDVVVENPSDETMTVNVTVAVGNGDTVDTTESEVTDIAAGEQKEVTLTITESVGDLRYSVDAKEVEN